MVIREGCSTWKWFWRPHPPFFTEDLCTALITEHKNLYCFLPVNTNVSHCYVIFKITTQSDLWSFFFPSLWFGQRECTTSGKSRLPLQKYHCVWNHKVDEQHPVKEIRLLCDFREAMSYDPRLQACYEWAGSVPQDEWSPWDHLRNAINIVK